MDSASGSAYEDANVGLGLVALFVFDGETPRMVHAHIGKRQDLFDSSSWHGRWWLNLYVTAFDPLADNAPEKETFNV